MTSPQRESGFDLKIKFPDLNLLDKFKDYLYSKENSYLEARIIEFGRFCYEQGLKDGKE